MLTSSVHFNLGTHPVTGSGLGVAEDDFQEATTGPVAELVFDDAGTSSVEALLDGLADTAFARDNFDQLFADGRDPEDWRVGEALAEHHLSESHDCTFPWPDGRDERKRGSSLPGADLVGFQERDGQDRFAFGEVKTSAEASYPPGAAYGRHGLKQQMEDLRDRQDIRDGLVLYLGYRATGTDWEERFRASTAAYLRNPCEVSVFGLLVRDVEPHEDDLRARVTRLGNNCPAGMVIKLVAIYLPEGSISELSAAVVSSRQQEGGDS